MAKPDSIQQLLVGKRLAQVRILAELALRLLTRAYQVRATPAALELLAAHDLGQGWGEDDAADKQSLFGAPVLTLAATLKEVQGLVFVGDTANIVVFYGLRIRGFEPACP